MARLIVPIYYTFLRPGIQEPNLRLRGMGLHLSWTGSKEHLIGKHTDLYLDITKRLVPVSIIIIVLSYCQAQPQLKSTQLQLNLRLRLALIPLSPAQPQLNSISI